MYLFFFFKVFFYGVGFQTFFVRFFWRLMLEFLVQAPDMLFL